jgi:hypothetical protein
MNVKTYCARFGTRAAVLILATIGAGGCTTGKWLARHAQPTSVVREDRQIQDRRITDDPKQAVNADGKPNYVVLSYDQWVKLATSTSDGAVCPVTKAAASQRGCRNSAQSKLIAISNFACERHLAGVYGYSTAYRTWLSGLTSLFSGASAIVDGRAAQNLATGAAFTNSTRDLITAEVYLNQVNTAITGSVRRLRAEKMAEIAERRKLGIDDYEPSSAIEDALSYHDLCAFYRGLEELVKQAGAPRVDPFAAQNILALQAQLATLQQQLAAATTDDAKAALNDEIAKLNTRLLMTRVVVPQANSASDAPVTPVAPDSTDTPNQ